MWSKSRKKKNNLYEWLDHQSFELEVLVSEETKPQPAPPVVVRAESSRPAVQQVIPKASPKSFSIKDAIEGKVQEPPKKIEVLPDVTSEEESLDDDSDVADLADGASIFTQLELEKQWQLFVQSYLSEKPRYASLMSTYQPLLNPDFQVKIVLESQLQCDMFTEIKNELTHFLRVKLNNKSIVLVLTIQAQDSTSSKIYTVEDKFKYLSQLNPKLINLKQQLSLDFD